jgi:putative ABC transport system substrate-binding protein
MRRRDFLAALGGAAAAWPLVARAQQAKAPTVGVLGSETPDIFADRLRAFAQGLRDAGYVEGRNVVFEYRWAETRYDRLPQMASDLVSRRVDVIVAMGGVLPTLAAKAATATIPIVFAIGADPVEFKLVSSLSRPGGNLTGVTNLNLEVVQKRLELLHEMVPTAARIGALVDPGNPLVGEENAKELQAAAAMLGLQLRVLQAGTEADLERAFASLAQQRGGALVITNDPFLNTRVEQLAALTARYAMPAIHSFRAFPAAGGLASYGASVSEEWRIAGSYTGRILKGEKPADLPVQQSTKVELVINLKTAKALGITVPITLLGRADEVIE